MIWKPNRLVIFGLLGLFLMSGCGVYSASSGRVDENIKRVYVDFLENMTTEPNLGVNISDDIIQAIQFDNTLKVVEEGEADSVISGKVVRYVLKQVAAREDLTVNEYQVQVAVQLDFSIRATGENIFKNKRFTGTGNYVLDDSGTEEETARDEAVEEIVRDILAMVVEDW